MRPFLEFDVHITNAHDFLGAAKVSKSSLLQAYLGLVAVELVLKSKVALSDHDVCSGIERFRLRYCKGADAYKGVGLTAIRARLRGLIASIYVNDRNGNPRLAPPESYPYLRYTRLASDAWPVPFCDDEQLTKLALEVQHLRAFLRTNFGLKL